MNPPMPTSVRVGPFTYAISTDPLIALRTKADSSNVFLRGETHTALNEIMLDPTLHPEQMRKTLLHEVLHCIWDVVGNRQEKVDEEDTVTMLSAMLLDTLQRNPGLVDYLTHVA